MNITVQNHFSRPEPPHDLPQCKWLETFFNQSGEAADTVVAIIDSHGPEGRLSKRTFVSCRDLEDASCDLASALRVHPLDIATRIVILVHGEYNKVHRRAVQTLRSTYDLDPLFLMSHFYWDDRTSGKHQCPLSDFVPPISLPSLVHFLALDYQGQFTGILLKDISPPTGKMLIII